MESIATIHQNLKISTTAEEQELIRGSLAGDERTQYRLYRKYVRAMYHTILRMVGRSADAEDLTQEVFAKVFSKLDSFNGEATLGAWIKKIAIHVSLNFLRRERQIRWIDLEEHLDISVETEPFPETDIRYSLERIHEAIKNLPDGCRVVFNLYLLEGYQHQEIAEILGITTSTSKTQYRRARQILKEILG